jgi:hypothetical protein
MSRFAASRGRSWHEDSVSLLIGPERVDLPPEGVEDYRGDVAQLPERMIDSTCLGTKLPGQAMSADRRPHSNVNRYSPQTSAAWGVIASARSDACAWKAVHRL